MQTEIKTEPADDFWDDPLHINNYLDTGELSQYEAGPSRFRMRLPSTDTNNGFRLPDVTGSSRDATNRLLQQWGLEALCERFTEHLIDVNVLDYILDVDIVDLCRGLPIRYRLVLRHNLQNGYHRRVIITEQAKQPTQKSTTKRPQTKDHETPNRKKKKPAVPVTPTVPCTSQSGVDPSQIVRVEEDVSIHDILAKEPKFRQCLNDLERGLVPEIMALRFMNRILTGYFFEERILEQSDYPRKDEKHALALKILETYPQLERTRITPDAPKESYFFWINGGKEKGPHTGLIEYRTTNLRREVPPEKRRFLRAEKKQIVLSDSIREKASHIASLPPVPGNEQAISDGMAECMDLHLSILQQTESNQAEVLVSTFPHLLSYGGRMVQQVFKRFHSNYDESTPIDKFLVLGLLLDAHAFAQVENKHIRATLRIMKKLIMIGKKEESDEMSTEEAEASSLIRWIKCNENELEIYTVQQYVSERSNTAPHIVCLADVFREGNMYIIFQDKFIHCGTSAVHSMDVLFKLFTVFAIPVPVMLRKIHELLMVYLWKITTSCKSVTVSKMMAKLEELDVFNQNDSNANSGSTS